MENVKVYDNGGKTLDRYAVVIGKDVYTMSTNALSPQGVNQYGGKFADVEGHLLGKTVKFEDLPQEVRKAIAERVPKFEFPKTLPWTQFGSTKGEYALKENIEDKYAFYEKELVFGFKHGYEMELLYFAGHEDRKIVRVKTLSGNSWGKGTYLIIREDFFKSMADAIGHLKGETRVYPPKRKPERIREMTAEEINEYVGEKVIKTEENEE